MPKAKRNLGTAMEAEANRAQRTNQREPLQPEEASNSRRNEPNLARARRERDLLKQELKGSPLKSASVKLAEAQLEQRSWRQGTVAGAFHGDVNPRAAEYASQQQPTHLLL